MGVRFSSYHTRPDYGATQMSLAIRQQRHHPVIADADLRCRTPADFRLLALVHHHYAGKTVCACIAQTLRDGARATALLDAETGRVHCDDCFVVFMECVECSRRLLQARFPLDTRAPSGATPMYYALLGKNFEVTCMLLMYHASLNPRPPLRDDFIKVCRLCAALPELLASAGAESYLGWLPFSVRDAVHGYAWNSTKADE